MSKMKLKPPATVEEIWEKEFSEDPYPEFEQEVFEGYKASGLSPDRFSEPERSKYAAWLKDRPPNKQQT